MLKFRLMSFLIFLCSFHGYTAVENTSDNYLPPVFIKHDRGAEFKYPNQIKKATIKDNGFTGGTLFSRDNNEDQIFFCPAKSDRQLNKIKKYNDLIHIKSSQPIVDRLKKINASKNYLFNQKFAKEDPLRCDQDPIPVIYPLNEGKVEKETVPGCGPNKEGVLYKIVYELCTSISKRQRIFEYNLALFVAFRPDVAKYARKLPFYYIQKKVYKICYNHRTNETIYAKHKISPSSLLFDERLKHERNKEFRMITDEGGYFNFSKLKPFYDSLSNNPTEQTQLSNDEKVGTSDYSTSISEYSLEKLVPSDDMPTAVLRKPTFHFINVKPMHKRLVELWNYIEKLIRENFRDKDEETNSKIEIYTGAFDYTTVDPNHSLPKNLPPDVPELWIKVIYEKDYDLIRRKNPSLAIIMKNGFEFNGQSLYHDHTLASLCKTDYCESFKRREEIWKKFPDLLGNIVCCPFNTKIYALFEINLSGSDAPLHITDLTDDKVENLQQGK